MTQTQSDDLVTRLQAWSKYGYDQMHTQAGRNLYASAAAEIQRLQAQVAVAREALRRCDRIVEQNLYRQHEKVEDVRHVSRAALASIEGAAS